MNRLDRQRDHRLVKRTNCTAKFRVHYKPKKTKWTVVAFVKDHNHGLTLSEHIHVIPSYRSVSNADKAQVDSLHLYGMRT